MLKAHVFATHRSVKIALKKNINDLIRFFRQASYEARHIMKYTICRLIFFYFQFHICILFYFRKNKSSNIRTQKLPQTVLYIKAQAKEDEKKNGKARRERRKEK